MVLVEDNFPKTGVKFKNVTFKITISTSLITGSAVKKSLIQNF